MKLTPMRYKDYTWPHNPETCRMELERKLAAQKIPFGGWVMQEGNWQGGIVAFQCPLQKGCRERMNAIVKELGV